MAASAIAISSDSSDESVGSPPSRVILFGDIPTVIPSTYVGALETSTIAPVISYAAPMVETTRVASPTGFCGLVPYSDSDSDSPDKMDSPEYITPLPATSPFLYTDSLEASDSSDRPPSHDPYVTTVASILIRPGKAIPLGRPYRTRPNRPRRVMTARMRVGPLPALHSSGLDAPDQAHSGSLARDVSPRLESSSGDSTKRPPHSSSHSTGQSHKRCSSPVDSVPSSTPVMGSLALTRVDLLPPRKRFRDSYSSEASIEEDTGDDPTDTEIDIELGTGDRDEVRDHVEIDPRDVRDDIEEHEADTSAGDTVEVGIDPRSVPVADEESEEPTREDYSDSSGTRDGIVRSFKDISINLDDAVCDFYHHMYEVRIDRIVEIETDQRRLEADQLISRGERAGMVERIESLRLENLKVRAMLDIERDPVNSLRLHMSLSQEEFRQVRMDHDDTQEVGVVS
ncbi:hypothetical protein Tco_0232830 [Tanacetum coccineum]